MALIDTLMSPLILIGGAAVIGTLAVLMYLRKGGLGDLGGGGSKKYVLLLRNKDRRFKRIRITNETDESLESPKEKNGVTRHFEKRGAGWTDEDRPQTMFLGFNAYKYTLTINTVKESVINLAKAVRIVLGKEVYDVIQPELRDKLEKAEFGILIEPDDPFTSGASATMGNEARHTESDHVIIDYYAKKVKQALQGKMQWNSVVMGVAVGVVLGIMLVNFKVIKLG